MKLPVSLRREIASDFQELPSEKLREQALIKLAQLRKYHLLGELLAVHPTMGDLSDCRKIYFDVTRDRSPRWRIVYRVIPSETDPREVDVIIIGPRANGRVYLDALTRLRRKA